MKDSIWYFFTEISRCIYERVTNIFWLYSCYFGKIQVCVVTKILLHGFHASSTNN